MTNYTLSVAARVGGLAGRSAGVRAARKVAAAQGAFTESGQAAGLRATHLPLTAVYGAFALTGQVAAVIAARLLAAAQGAFTESGQAVGLLRTRIMVAVAGDYVMTGVAAGFWGPSRTASVSLAGAGRRATLVGLANRDLQS